MCCYIQDLSGREEKYLQFSGKDKAHYLRLNSNGNKRGVHNEKIKLKKRHLATITITAPAAVDAMFSTRDKENVLKNMILEWGKGF